MQTTVFPISLPNQFLHFGFDQAEIQNRVVEWLVLSLFTEGRISSGKAANWLNLSRVEFLAFLRNRGIAYLNYTPTELAAEFAAVESLKVKRTE
jgi:predicted HTH domain antitoxin